MFNKKAIGIEWDVLAIAFFIAVGIVTYSSYNVNIPKVGEIPLNTIQILEKNSRLPIIIEGFMKLINEKTTTAINENKIFKLRSYCENEGYKGGLDGKSQALIGDFGPLEGRDANCYINEDDLRGYFSVMFEANYNSFRQKDLKDINLELTNTVYTSSVEKKDGKYHNTLNTSNGFDIPINIEKDGKKTKIGKITMKPDYRLIVNYTFDNPAKEVCILSRDCGAACQDVVNKYSAKEYKIKEVPCNKYYDCAEGDDAKDDFGNYYTCKDGSGNNNYLCQGQCLPFCSSPDPTAIVDADSSTKCKGASCNSYMSCGTINPADKCGCPSSSYACEGSDCDTLHCERDPNPNTQCRDNCDKYGDCSSISSCACNTPLNGCEGTCYCNPGTWTDSGGCGGIAGDGTDCNWDSVPQSKTYDPVTCHSADYRCDYRAPSICQCVPDTSCTSLGCGVSDSCGTYCGDCPTY